jgi:hypothetical protein
MVGGAILLALTAIFALVPGFYGAEEEVPVIVKAAAAPPPPTEPEPVAEGPQPVAV